MITKEEFIEIIKKIQKHDTSVNEMYDSKVLDCDYISDHIYYAEEVIFLLLGVLFTNSGVDWISWWLYDRKKGYQAWDEEKKKIPTETIDDLWNIVEKYRK